MCTQSVHCSSVLWETLTCGCGIVNNAQIRIIAQPAGDHGSGCLSIYPRNSNPGPAPYLAACRLSLLSCLS